MAADAIFGFQKFKFVTAGTFDRPNLHHCSVIFVNENENKNGEKRENNEFV